MGCPSVDVAVAVATPAGLITPIVKAANTKSVVQISAEVRCGRAGRAVDALWVLWLDCGLLSALGRGCRRNAQSASVQSRLLRGCWSGTAGQRVTLAGRAAWGREGPGHALPAPSSTYVGTQGHA